MSESTARVEIVVYPGDVRFSCRKGVRLHEALARAGFPLAVPCGGGGTCGKCTVWTPPESFFSETPTVLHDMLSSPVQNFATLQELFPFQQALACQTVVAEPLIVWVPDESRHEDGLQIVVSHAPLDSDDTAAVPLTADMLLDRNDLHIDSHTASQQRYAVAIDIGTTTIAAELLPYADVPQRHRVVSKRNPQSEFGDDVISRIQFASESRENLARLRQAIINAIDAMIAELARDEGVSPERIDLVALAGNTTMQQLFAGIDVQSLGHAPFVPATKTYPAARAADYGLVAAPNAAALVFPVIGGFVGGDIVAGITAVRMRSQHKPALLIDIGTNGEIVLWNPGPRQSTSQRPDESPVSQPGVLLTAATAAGPAFEGARIRHGMIAAPGAIERVTLDDDLHVETIGNRPPRGICGSGLIDLVAELLRVGAITASGKLLSGDQLPDGVPAALRPRFVTADGRPGFVVVSQKNSATGSDILLTQHDIRQVQLASGAIRAGVTLLLRKAGVAPGELDAVFLAGGFGNYIRRENAQRIGLLPPDIPTERIRFCGNTSLAGVKAVLLDTARYREMQTAAELAECIDLSTFSEFATVFAESMLFP